MPRTKECRSGWSSASTAVIQASRRSPCRSVRILANSVTWPARESRCSQRSRASASFAFSSSSRLASVPITVRVIGACALAAWVVGAALYARAVAEPVALETGTQKNAEEFVRKVLENAKKERDKIDSRRRVAQREYGRCGVHNTGSSAWTADHLWPGDKARVHCSNCSRC